MKSIELNKTVIEGGFCIGCGICSANTGSPFKVILNEYGQYTAKLVGADNSDKNFNAICPFGSEAASEDDISKERFTDQGNRHNEIGFSLGFYVGAVTDLALRNSGSSGAIGRWLTSEMLRQGIVDSVIYVTVPTSSSNLHQYVISSNPLDVLNASKSAYYPITLEEVISRVRSKYARYVVVGVPCFIKAIHLLAKHDPVIRERIIYTVGIICGHLKSKAFAELFAWQLGVLPDDLGGIEFRGKLAGLPANQKGVMAKSKSKNEWTDMIPSRSLIGGDWGLGFFKYKACDYCDDVVAETADISIGDAWLPEYINDSRGNSIIICRDKNLQNLILSGREKGALALENIGIEDVIKSQDAGLRHRHEGLRYRLWKDQKKGIWTPQKRVRGSIENISSHRRRIYDLREKLRDQSHLSFANARKKGELNIFKNEMASLIKEYRDANESNLSNLLRKIRLLSLAKAIQRFLKCCYNPGLR